MVVQVPHVCVVNVAHLCVVHGGWCCGCAGVLYDSVCCVWLIVDDLIVCVHAVVFVCFFC